MRVTDWSLIVSMLVLVSVVLAGGEDAPSPIGTRDAAPTAMNPESLTTFSVEQALHDDERAALREMEERGVFRSARGDQGDPHAAGGIRFGIGRAVPPNDLCENAIDVGPLPADIFGTTTGAGSDSPPAFTCGTSLGAPGVWYSVVGTGSALTASLCNAGTAFDTNINVFHGDCTAGLICVGGNDQGGTGCGNSSLFTWCSSPGTIYYVLIQGHNNGTSDFELTVTDDGVACVQACCVGGVSCVVLSPIECLAMGGTPRGPGTDCLDIDCTGACCFGNGTCAVVSATDCFAQGGTPQHVGTDCQMADCVTCSGQFVEQEVPCYDGYVDSLNGGCNWPVPVFSQIGCDTTVCGTAGTYLFTNEYGSAILYRDTDWYKLVLPSPQLVTATLEASFDGHVGIIDTQGIDDCAVVSTPSGFLVSSTGPVCTVQANLGAGTWYIFAAPKFAGIFDPPNIVECGSEYELSVICDPPILEACCFGDASCLDLITQDCLASGGVSQGPGTQCQSANCIGVPANDLCEDAIDVGPLPATIQGSTVLASTDAPPAFTCGTSISVPGVWYTVTGTGSTLTASICVADSTYYPKVNVFRGDCATSLTCVGGNGYVVAGCNRNARYSWCSSPGVVYHMLVQLQSSESGDFELTVTDDGVACAQACCFGGVSCVSLSPSECTVSGGSPGGVGSDCQSVPCIGTPPNDLCEDAIEVGPLPAVILGTTVLASIDVPPAFYCGTSVGSAPGLWYTVTGTGTSMTASLCNPGTTFDTKMNVYRGDCATGLICVGGNDDGGTGCGNSSRFTWCSSPGTTYYVLVHGNSVAKGNFELAITENGASCLQACCFEDAGCESLPVIECLDSGGAPQDLGTDCLTASCLGIPPNDLCEDAIDVGPLPASILGSTSFATIDFGGAYTYCGTSVNAPGVWYTVTGTGGLLTASLCNPGTNYDTRIHVFGGDCGTGLICVNGNDNGETGCGTASRITWCSDSGMTYYVLVDGYSGKTGNFELTVADDGIYCSRACCFADAGCEEMGSTECALAGGDPQGIGTGCITTICEGVPSNDLCEDAIDVGPLPASLVGNTLFASPDAPPITTLCSNSSGYKGVWYTVMGTGNTLTASTCNPGTDFDTAIDVFRGNCSTGLVCVGGSNNVGGTCGYSSSYSWCSSPGTIYFILVHGPTSVRGHFQLTVSENSTQCARACCLNDTTCMDLSTEQCRAVGGIEQSAGSFCQSANCSQVPSNNLCQDAIDVGPLPASILGTTLGAGYDEPFPTNDPSLPAFGCGTTISAVGVWYTVTGTGNSITASLCNPGTAYDTKINVYCGGCASGLICVGGNDNGGTGCGNSSRYTWCSSPDTTYYLLIQGRSAAKGSFELAVTDDGTPCASPPDCPARCPGDINGDGLTNAADFVILAGNFGGAVAPGTGGDLNGDGLVNAADFVILAGDFGCGAP